MSDGGEVTLQRAWEIIDPKAVKRHRVVVIVGLVGAVTSALGGLPVVWALLTVVTLAASRRVDLRGAIERLPLSGVIVVAGAGAVTLVVGLLGVDVMSSPWTGRCVLAGLVIVLVVPALFMSPGHEHSGTRSWSELGPAAAPAGLMVVVGAVLAASPLGATTSWFLSGDHVRHLGLVTRTIDAGSLEYVSQTYPRAWHAALALLWSSTGSKRDAHGLAELIHLQSLATWAVLALLPLALALTAAALHRASGGRPFASGAAGATAGTLVLGPWFFGDYVPRGFETSVLALLVLAVAVLRVTESRSDRGALLVVAASGALMAHVWQVLLPAIGVLLVVVLFARWRPRPAARVLAGDTALLILSAALTVPGLLAAARGYGLGAISVAGDVPRPALGWLAIVVFSSAVLLAMRPSAALVACLTCVGTAVVTAFALALQSGVGLDSYYPNKTLWTGTALGLPLIGVAGANLFTRVYAVPRAGRPLVVVCGSFAACVLLLCAATPIVGVAGSWSAADGRVVVETVTSDAAPSATVVWRVGTEIDDATSQLLLDFYSATARTTPLGLAPRDVDEQCALLSAAAEPVLLSRAPIDEVRRRFSCAPATEVVSP